MRDFTAIQRSSLSTAVFDQVLALILDGTLPVGSALPAERRLTEDLGVNRQALREALQRLSQLGLVEIRHGGATRVCDYRSTAGLDLLPQLVLRPDGTIDPQVVGSMMEMRAAIGADAAALCAERADAACLHTLHGLVEELASPDGTEGQSAADTRFWDTIVNGSGNICYRLALNAVRSSYHQAEPIVRSVLAPERSAVHLYRDVVDAITSRLPAQARTAAAVLLQRGTTAIGTFLTNLEHQ